MSESSRYFVHNQRKIRVVFEPGSVDGLPVEADRLGCQRVVLVASARYVPVLTRLLNGRVAAVIAQALMHVPAEEVDNAVAIATATAADGVVAVGGGSAIGLAKALALRIGIPILAAPTTYSGSEMTRVWGITTAGKKATGRDEDVAPKTVVYDPDLLSTLPARAAIPSAFNAIAHAVEALYAPDRTPITDLYASQGIAALTRAIPLLTNGDDTAVADALYGAWLCGMCLDTTAMALHHKICHALGGTLGLPHAETHTAVLPHALAFNAPAAPDAIARLSDILDSEDPANYLLNLAKDQGAHTALRDVGMRLEDIDTVADEILAVPYANPREVTRDHLVGLLHNAATGAVATPNPVVLKETR